MDSSQTHRLCAFTTSTNELKHDVVPHYVADEVEALRTFVSFLYPPRGPDRFTLLRPDIHNLEWVVYDREKKAVYASGANPVLAVERAHDRRQEELFPTKL